MREGGRAGRLRTSLLTTLVGIISQFGDIGFSTHLTQHRVVSNYNVDMSTLPNYLRYAPLAVRNAGVPVDKQGCPLSW
jgi:hypothetical protein